MVEKGMRNEIQSRVEAEGDEEGDDDEEGEDEERIGLLDTVWFYFYLSQTIFHACGETEHKKTVSKEMGKEKKGEEKEKKKEEQ